ncbi:dephospho-CoA kinase [Ancylothrix sp. C2]|uniref:dephospho-CoA kinase n=1 Tax=Ancylothrix sp. D3o TaxID=2953691 RepID=UPI0021BA9B91|nr:dephospho-CoA kinase [Ancylothrix sp. D3o]MCT7948594.1 dephospho-CoA kinase [Ancylothrix sp. D3o]
MHLKTFRDSNNKKRIIGLTGSIATGKTTVSNYLAEKYGLPVFDADILAREAVAVGSPILEKFASRYPDILLADGSLNRPKLGSIIFNNSDERRWVESQIHPYVRQRFVEAISNTSHPTIVLAIPLLFEAQMTDLVTEIWVVYCNPETQIKRLMQRDNLSQEQAETRIKSQMSLEEKCNLATLILDNSTTQKNLQKQIDKTLKTQPK